MSSTHERVKDKMVYASAILGAVLVLFSFIGTSTVVDETVVVPPK
jgi:hypothetical protein